MPIVVMWLINVRTRQLEEFIGLEIQRYAILSHTWVGGQEVTFQEMRSCGGQSPPAALVPKSGWQKIDWTCRLAERDGLDYAWVDTCCIDKSSSAELSEAINSMFRWYERATVCYAFLGDLAPAPPEQLRETLEASIRHCRWFTRSWTLQELIAPRHINFYDRDWQFCFTKATASAALARITGVGVDILEHRRDLSAVSVAQKMSWAASRRSTRIEDAAYSLLGIFGINMPMLYGEEERAFLRLQTEIISSCPDYTILAWVLPNRGSEVTSTTDTFNTFSGVMASSPKLFRYPGEAPTLLDQSSSFEFSMANRGLKLRAQFGLSEFRGVKGSSFVLPVCRIKHETYGILVRNVGKGCFVRQDANILVRIKPWEMVHRLMLDPYLLTKLPAPRAVSTERRNLILESRQRVLEVVLPPSMELYRRWPWQQWDEADTLFFGEEAPGEDLGWAALKIVASAPPPFYDVHAPSCSIDFLFYAFGWTREAGVESEPEPRFTIHRVHGAVNDRALEQMNEEAVRDGWNAYWVANRLVSNSILEKSVLVASNFGQSTLLVTCKLQRAEGKRICARPFWRVAFDWEVVPRDQIPPVLDRGWKGINWGGIFAAPWDKATLGS
ncbi:hypothetical protein N0V82_001373 [Gnomoniopsis sp. IMI 355080]|nr:hypothetical protein N0V82_001373 [Gnomoniopsis sp. IMI 355080]